MKLLSIIQARSVWIGPLADLNPRGKGNPEFRVDLKDRYQFQTVPSSIYEAMKTTQNASFEAGVFTTKKKEKVTVTVTFNSGGLVADCRSSTADGDEFLEDMMNWLCPNYGYEDYRQIFAKRAYISTLNCSLNKPLDRLNPKLSKFAAMFGKHIVGFEDMTYETGVVHIWPNTTIAPKPPIGFRIERQEGTAPEENRFFSQAPTTTESHLELLKSFEELLE